MGTTANGVIVSVVLATSVVVGAPLAQAATPQWAPVGSASVRPGAEVLSPAGQCTSNFVFHDGPQVFLGLAAHCVALGAADDLDGCSVPSLPLGTAVTIAGASRPGTVAYSSWRTMALRGETDPEACVRNDFALIRVDVADVGRVNPTVPHWGGPVGLGQGTSVGERVFSYGSSRLRLGLTALSPKTGVAVGTTTGGWAHTVYTVTPGVPGDSGSAYLDSQGHALGVLSTINLLPLPASNGVIDLARALAYANTHALPGVRLATGTVGFTPNRLPLGL